jgi:hypothetical protein
MENNRTFSPSKRIIPIDVIILLFVFLCTINPAMIIATPCLAIWTFENINLSKADAREYVDGLIYYLE